jgi:hypothetical protein
MVGSRVICSRIACESYVEREQLLVNSQATENCQIGAYSIGTASRPMSSATSFSLRSSCSATALARRDRHSSSLTVGGGGGLSE